MMTLAFCLFLFLERDGVIVAIEKKCQQDVSEKNLDFCAEHQLKISTNEILIDWILRSVPTTPAKPSEVSLFLLQTCF